MDNLNVDNFNEKTSDGIVLVDFYADWCGPCKMLTPVLEALSSEMNHVTFYKVNIDDEQELTKKFKIMSVPTILLFKDGTIVKQTLGYSPKELIKKFIETV